MLFFGRAMVQALEAVLELLASGFEAGDGALVEVSPLGGVAGVMRGADDKADTAKDGGAGKVGDAARTGDDAGGLKLFELLVGETDVHLAGANSADGARTFSHMHLGRT